MIAGYWAGQGAPCPARSVLWGGGSDLWRVWSSSADYPLLSCSVHCSPLFQGRLVWEIQDARPALVLGAEGGEAAAAARALLEAAGQEAGSGVGILQASKGTAWLSAPSQRCGLSPTCGNS